MAVNIITTDDLEKFKNELIAEIRNLFHLRTTEQKLWLRSSEVKDLLSISLGTLQNLRTSGTLAYSKVGGALFYNFKDIEKLMTEFPK